MKLPSYLDGCVFALDFGAGLTDGNLFKDSGPHGLHLTPVNFVAPNYGLVQGPSGATCLRFNGTTQYAYMAAAAAARFYARAPTTTVTIAFVARHVLPAAGSFVFNARDIATTRGLVVRYSTTEILNLRGQDAGGVQTNLTDTNNIPLTGRTVISAYALDKTVLTGLIWHDGSGRAASIAGNTNPIAYDAGTAPTMGAQPGGGGYFNGDIYFAGLWSGPPWSLAEYQAFYRYWADRI